MTFSSESEDSETRSSILNLHPKLIPPERSKKVRHSDNKCKICGAAFSRPWRLKAHTYVHTGEKPFACEFEGCGKKYTSSSHLIRHKKTVHPEEDKEVKFMCNFPGCKAEFKHRQNEKRHMRRAHKNQVFPCSECTLSFRKHFQLKSHMQIHTGLPQFKCKECDRGFAKGRDYRRHLRGHRFHACLDQTCTELFSTWSLLRKHMAEKHRKEFTCHYCSKTFVVKSYLRHHVLRHLEELTGRRHRPKLELKLLACDQCGALIKGKASLNRHKKLVHDKNQTEQPRRSTVKKTRTTRKDAGIPKKSMAGVLAAVDDILPEEVHRKLIAKDDGEVVDFDNDEEFTIAVEGIVLEFIQDGAQKGIEELQFESVEERDESEAQSSEEKA